MSFLSYFLTLMLSVNRFTEPHWSVNLAVMSVFILSELGLNYIYIYIFIYTEFAWLSGGPLQYKILATPLEYTL